MKVLILFLALIAFSAAFIEFEHSNGDDILKELKKRNNGVILVLFVANADAGTDLGQTNADYEYHLLHKVLENYPSFKYARVDVTNSNYKSLVKASGISISDLYNSPSVLISEDRDGEWIHGDSSLTLVAKTARIYNERVQE
mmetsp:Transcript_17393/g.19514  ORF Transcript_17393/g.19514 Transcript_17393/m.19514 type:complete len:142 (+) Transcript_17393:27-452(+)